MSLGVTQMSSSSQRCMLSIDVEDWFHLVGAGLDYQFRVSPGGADGWDSFPGRVTANTQWVLDLLDQSQTRATFFILGWVAERYPALVREIQHRGHEIGSHSYWHKVIQAQTPAQFRDDVRRSVAVLQDITGQRVLGFRSSSASIANWTVDILAEEGLLYDSSLFPVIYHDVYGRLEGSDPHKPIERLRNGLWEVKFSSLDMGGRQLPWSGGGYFRLLPYYIFSRGLRQILARQRSFMFYLHPWEVDHDPPQLPNLKLIYHFRRYFSIHRTRGRFEHLLREFRFVPILDVLREKMEEHVNA